MKGRYHEEWSKKNAPDMLYFLAAQDTLERLDTLILELRHLQASIISHLREPSLYKLLRREEKYLWGGGNDYTWRPFLDDDYISPEKFAADKILLFPVVKRRDSKKKQGSRDNETAVKEREEINKIILDIWYSRGWSNSQKQNYHVLRTTQKIKRQLFSDKLYLIKHANKLGVLNFRPTKEKAKFIVLRAGIHKKIRGYIDRIRDLKNIFNDFMDGGRQDHPRPSIMRRREVGIYKEFLSDRSRDVRRDMHMLLNHLGVPTGENIGVILHRWRHDSTSKTASFLDEIDRYLYLTAKPNNRDFEVGETEMDFVNSSYFMPERPDLQSSIAHEVAHRAIQARFDDFSFFGLRNRTDAFSDLIFDIQDATETFLAVAKIDIPSRILRYFYKELACDFLASCLEGFSFVYALFLENLGHGLDSLLEVENGTIDLSMLAHIESLKPSSLYYRLFITRILLNCKWVMAIHHEAPCKLDSQLITGIEEICFKLEEYLNSTLHDITRADVENWSILSRRLFEITKESTLHEIIKDWRRSRGKNTKEKINRFDWPVSNWTLPDEARKLIYSLQLKLKDNDPANDHIRPLEFQSADEREFEDDFYSLYGLGVCEKSGLPPRVLYRHLYDIPWQCALMRSIDVFVLAKSNEEYGVKEVIRDIHYDFALGRELFSVGLEYYMWYTEPDNLRLITVVNLLNTLQALLKKDSSLKKDSVFDEIYEIDNAWLGIGSVNYKEVSDRIDELENKLNKMKASTSYDFLEEEVKSVSARVISSSFSIIKDFDYEGEGRKYLYRCIELMAGLKLDSLAGILKDTSCKELIPIENFLKNRITNTKEWPHEFFESIKSAITCSSGEKQSDTLRSIKYYMIGRHTFSGAYTGPDNGSDNSSYLRIADIQKQKNQEFKVNHSGVTYFQNLIPSLGRYDTITLYPTKPLCRCELPVFDTLGYMKNERYPLYSSRREYATKLSFSEKTANDYNSILGIIVVVLQKKSYRLNFLSRLFNNEGKFIRGVNAKRKQVEEAAFIDQIHGVLDDDYGYLIDGWGDIMLVLTDPPSPSVDSELENSGIDKRYLEKLYKLRRFEKVKTIFKFQELLFKDFMVDSLETIFTPDALNCTWGSKGFEIRVETRLIEDRLLFDSNEKYTKSVKDKIEKYQKGFNDENGKNKKLDIQYSAAKVAGRMDYSFHIMHHCQSESTKSTGKIQDEETDYTIILNDIFNHDLVETIETKLNSYDIAILNNSMVIPQLSYKK